METGTSRPGSTRDVSQELRQSLATITALLRAAARHGGVPTETRHCLEQVDAEVRDLASLCDELVGVSWAVSALGGADGGRPSHPGRPATERLGEVIAIDEIAAASMRRTGEAADAGTATPTRTLTGQERRILALIARGCTNRQIGEQLFLAEKTVKNYVSNLLRKLNLESRTQAAIYATRLSGSTRPMPGSHPSGDRRIGLAVVPPSA